MTASLRSLVEEVAAFDARDPAWWLVLGLAELVERWPWRRRGAPEHLASDAQPGGDTFIGWPAPPPTGLAGAIADTVLDAHAAAAAVAALDGTLPGQPLAVALDVGRGRAARRVDADPWTVGATVAGRRTRLRLSGGPDALVAAATALARVARGERGDAGGRAVIAAVVGDHDPAVARHLHRAAWTDAGGPWLGVGRAGELAVATTCHLVVDGYGHARLAAAIADARPRDGALRAALTRAAAAVVGDAAAPAAPRLADAEPLGVAWRRLARRPRLAALAHALGVVLHAEAPTAFSPTIQIPVAPGSRDDAARHGRRVVHALASVRFADGVPEPLDAFAARLSAAIAREGAGGGLLTRLTAAAAALPIPLALKRRRVVGARGPFLDAPVEVLAGRASLSVLRLPADAGAPPPLVAVSAPGRVLTPADRRTSSVITVIDDPAGSTVTVAGTGGSGTPAGAAALLDRWLAAARA